MAVGGYATPESWTEDVGRKGRTLKFTGVDVTPECVETVRVDAHGAPIHNSLSGAFCLRNFLPELSPSPL